MIRWRHVNRRVGRTSSPGLALILGLALLLLAFWSTFEGGEAGSGEAGDEVAEASEAGRSAVTGDSGGTRESAAPLPPAAPGVRTTP